jgi:hypothetical protein
MTRTSSRFIDPARLKARGETGVVLVRLMMACNDMTLANESLAEWKPEQPRDRAYRQLGAMRYFVRLQMGHCGRYFAILIWLGVDNSPRFVPWPRVH